MQRIGTLLIVLAVLFSVAGCGVARRATRSPETDALLRAARAGNADTVRALLASPSVDVNGIDEHGNTPLIEAARFGHDELVAALLIAKADVKKKNDEGKTALCWQPKADMMKPLGCSHRPEVGSKRICCSRWSSQRNNLAHPYSAPAPNAS